MAVNPQYRYSNESEWANQDIDDNFNLKNPLVSMVYAKIFQRFNGWTLNVDDETLSIFCCNILKRPKYF